MLSCSVVSNFCHLMDYSPPGSSVHGFIQARILKWVASSFSTETSQPRDRTHIAGIKLLYCRQILFCLSHQGSPFIRLMNINISLYRYSVLLLLLHTPPASTWEDKIICCIPKRHLQYFVERNQLKNNIKHIDNIPDILKHSLKGGYFNLITNTCL